MSKRKNRPAANLPQETLERARRQAAIERGEALPEPIAPAPQPREEAPRDVKPFEASVTTGANPYRTKTAAQLRAEREARTGRRTRTAATRRAQTVERSRELDQETIAELLENPTREVSEEELRRDYGYVLADVRSMFTLAAGLIVALVVLALVLPK